MRARRLWAWPLVPLYRAGLMAKDGLRAGGVLKTRRLGWPVVSVGSISAGGAGKTPVVIALAQLLAARGWAVDVLSRGYGRAGRGVERVEPEAEDAAERYGDEPVLIAQRTGVPVWVGAQRLEAGRAAEAARAGVRGVHLLDDGFQHRQLAREVDIVLVTEADVEDSLLPGGNLREPLSGLRRASVVVVREEERESVLARTRGLVPASAAVWSVRRRLVVPVLSGGQFAFCAIARPGDFLCDLSAAKVDVTGQMVFADHHRYRKEDMDRLIAACGACGAQGFITTEKDAVKLTPAMRERLASRALLTVARLETQFIDEDAVMRDLEARLQ